MFVTLCDVGQDQLALKGTIWIFSIHGSAFIRCGHALSLAQGALEIEANTKRLTSILFGHSRSCNILVANNQAEQFRPGQCRVDHAAFDKFALYDRADNSHVIFAALGFMNGDGVGQLNAKRPKFRTAE